KGFKFNTFIPPLEHLFLPPPPRARRLVVLLLLLVLVGSALPAVQAQGYWYGGLDARNTNIQEGRDGKFTVWRAAVFGGLPQQTFRLCFSGSATEGEDYSVGANHRLHIPLDGSGCFTESFDRGHDNFRFSISTKHDGNGSPETINVRLDRLPGSSYYLLRDRLRFRIVNG
ncbi:MAG: hypothetical protein OXN94_08305, partial [Chloroflexota bacterium]|nr:hypothetical protein [Chloroflexota bacterium]